jgi:hypothetical protein
MLYKFLTKRADETLSTIKAIRKLPGDTTRAQQRVLRSAVKLLPPTDQVTLALALESLDATLKEHSEIALALDTEVSRG